MAATTPAVRLGWAQHFFIGYSVLVPALAIVGLPALYRHAGWLGDPGLAPWGPFLALCSSVACIFYLGFASHRLSFPRNPLWCLALALDTPLVVVVAALFQGRTDSGIFGWDGVIELCSVMLAAIAIGMRARPRRDGLVMACVIGVFGALAPCTLLVLLLESPGQAVVVGIAVAGGAATWFRLLRSAEISERSDTWQTRWMLTGIGAVLAALGYRAYQIVVS